MPRRIASALPSWIVAVIGTVYAVALGGGMWAVVISATMGASLLVSFVVQLSMQRKEGLVNRLAFTTAGSLVIGATGIAVAWAQHGLG
ncbi:MAG: hypothetical protein NWS64_01840 [Microbacteriaceae bacterium]|nr:hypothetical protein [Microbacteriaceae bacterium]